VERDGDLLVVMLDAAGTGSEHDLDAGPFRRVVLLALDVDAERIGILKLKSRLGGTPTPAETRLVRAAAESLGVCLVRHASRSGLRERVKELTCLYEIVQIAMVPGRSLDETLSRIVRILPKAWQHAETAEARVVFDGRTFRTPGFDRVKDVQKASIVQNDVARGLVEVGYTERELPQHEGPFLGEERKLIDAVAHEIGFIADRLEAQERRARLEEQLRHADRLISIGQLAAGVAHELNEPLANILGFAQLAAKAEGLPADVARDLERIVASSLYARDFIRRLLMFARAEPAKKAPLDFHGVIEEVLTLFEVRWARQNVTVERDLSEAAAIVDATRSELQQVLMNLLANAVQAMPEGGTLTVATRVEEGRARLIVADTGVGMNERVRKQIFHPFFTTKGAGQGTGLGLSVARDIVVAHKGTIRVESRVGEGSRFEIEVPLARKGEP
jgi:signal transduction histidine kinase